MKINGIYTHLAYIKEFIAVGLLCISSAAMAQKQTIHLPESPLTIKTVIQAIEQQTGLSVDYNQTRLNVTQQISIPSNRTSLDEILKTVLSPNGFTYHIEKTHLIISQANGNQASQVQQKKIVSGIVIDESDEPLVGANIVENGTSNGIRTDENGHFTLEVAGTNSVLQVSYLGHLRQQIRVGTNTDLHIKLAKDVQNLDEVVIVGYGTLSKREITGSVTNITAKDFNQGFSNDAARLLQGKVAGLEINTGTGDVTANASIRLRGISTLQNDQGPFIVIDNVPGADITTVAPQDIESISILKDASAAAIYGSRSAGGVILITTKRGTANQPKITYTGAVGISSLANKPLLMSATKWREYTSTTPGKDGSSFDLGANTDWFDAITRTGTQQDHNVSLSGGGTRNNYRGSVSMLQRNGIARDNSMERYNARLQFTQWSADNKLKIDLTGAATLTDNTPTNTRNFVLAYNMIPVRPIKLDDGSWYDSREYDQGNPVRNQVENTYENKINNFYGTANITYTPVEGLDLKVLLTKSRNNEDYSEYRSIGSEAGYNDGGFALRSGTITDRNLSEWTANYSRQFGSHKVNLLGGYSWEQQVYAAHAAQTRGYITDLLGPNDLASGRNIHVGDATSARNKSRLISFYGRLNYNYLERYLLTATVRRDGSSKFGKNHKWGTFPSLSVGWNISEEPFMQNTAWVNDLKLRVGYGVTGNQSGLDPYKTLELFGSDGLYYDNGAWLPAYSISQNANPDLKWEQTAMLNVGLDVALFANRLNAKLEWYDKKTSDMLYTYPVPTPPYLMDEIMANVGDMDNKGVELTLGYAAIQNPDFNWDISVNLSHNRNRITKLSNAIYTTDRILLGGVFIRGGSSTTHVLEVGRPIGQFYGLRSEGLDADGKYMFIDQNDDGEISDPADLDYIGDAQPDLLYGINNAFRYKQFDLSVFFRGSIGNDILNAPRMAFAQSGFLPGTNALDDPLTYQLQETTPRYSSFYIENGSYLRLDNLSLGYRFNDHILNGARLYFTAQNVFVITDYKGLDPEVPIDDNSGLTPGIEPREFYPKARTFALGVSVNF